MNTPTVRHIPHTLRLIIFFLRVTLGLNFFYIGFTTLFDKALQADIQGRSMSGLYRWLATPSVYSWLHGASEWAFLIIGACLIIGFATRISSLIGLIVVAMSYLPAISFITLNFSQFVNDQLIIFFCLLIIFAANAGTYLGLTALGIR